MRTFAAYLLDRGAVELGDLDRATERQALLGGDLGAHLLGAGAIDEPALLAAWSDYHGRPAGPAGRLEPLTVDLEQRLPLGAARRYAVFPIALGASELFVATDFPLPDALAEELAGVVGCPIQQVVVSPLRLREAFWRYAGQPLPTALRDTLELLDGARAVEEGPSILGPRSTKQPGSKQARSYRRMVETAEQKIMPADRSSSVSLLSAMVASRLGPANAEADPGFERGEPGSLEPVEPEPLELDGQPAAPLEPAAGPSGPPVAPPAARPGEPLDDQPKGAGPDTERNGRCAHVASEATSAEAATARPAQAAPPAGPAPVFVEWREVAGLVELEVDRGEIPDDIGRVEQSDRPPGRPALDEATARPPAALPEVALAARSLPTAEPGGPEIITTELEPPESTDLASLVADEPPAPLSAAPSSQTFRHRGPFPRVSAEVALETAATVGQVLDIFVRFARQYFERMVLWTVQARRAEVRQSYGMPRELAGVVHDLDEPSLLRQAHDAAQIVVDVPVGGGFDRALRDELGLAPGVHVVVVPIRVRQRVVALLHADDVDLDVDRDAVAEVGGVANLVGNALAALIVRRKRAIPF